MLVIYLVALPLVLLAVSGTYFFADRRNTDIVSRLLYSSHGAIACVLFAGAFLVAAVFQPRVGYGLPFLALYTVPLGVALASLIRYRGPKIVHLLQVPNICAMLFSLVIGHMAVTGEWL